MKHHRQPRAEGHAGPELEPTRGHEDERLAVLDLTGHVGATNIEMDPRAGGRVEQLGAQNLPGAGSTGACQDPDQAHQTKMGAHPGSTRSGRARA